MITVKKDNYIQVNIKAGRALHLPEQVEAGAGAQCQGLSDPSPCVCGHVAGGGWRYL